jgi:UDP:flavonoid glycosyltransferase YjiC (YdhE family)
MTELIFEAVRKTGQLVLLFKGWGGMGADELRILDDVFILGNVPHDWLFKHVSCVIHHVGGAGTTAAGITAGRPTLVVPFFGDQPFWGAMVARAGAGPDPIAHKQLAADKLANAINFCLKPWNVPKNSQARSRRSEAATWVLSRSINISGLTDSVALLHHLDPLHGAPRSG